MACSSPAGFDIVTFMTITGTDGRQTITPRCLGVAASALEPFCLAGGGGIQGTVQASGATSPYMIMIHFPGVVQGVISGGPACGTPAVMGPVDVSFVAGECPTLAARLGASLMPEGLAYVAVWNAVEAFLGAPPEGLSFSAPTCVFPRQRK